MTKSKARWSALIALVLAAAVLASCSAPKLPNVQIPFIGGATPTATSQTQSASTPVRRGDLTITVDGTGTLLSAKDVSLGFGVAGTITDVAVKLGDKVTPGQVLARLDATTLRNQIVQGGIALRKAQVALDTVHQPPTADQIAAAQSTLAAAQSDLATLTKPATPEDIAAARSDLASTQQALATLQTGPSADSKKALEADMRSAEVAVQKAQSDYNQIAWQPNAGMSTQAATLQTATIAYEKAKAQYAVSTAAPAASDVAAARAKISTAQAALDKLLQGPDASQVAAAKAKVQAAEAQLNQLVAGPTADAVETAELNVQQAQNDLNLLLVNLQGTEIRSPVTGTVTALTAVVGQQAGTSPVVTIADQSSTQVQFWVEELDAAKLKLGDKVNVTFQALPQYTYTGTIALIEPKLVTVDNAPAAQAWAAIDPKQNPANLLYGMDANVQVVAGEAKNALLAPIQAVRELAPNTFAVFVVQPNGELALRPVKVGLRDLVNAEILSGLKDGDVVSTGTAATQGSSQRSSSQNGAGGQGGSAQGGGQRTP